MLRPFEFGLNCQATVPNSRSLELTSLYALSVRGANWTRIFSNRSLFTSHREHHFAEVFAAFEIALRSASFRQRECLVDNHFKLSITDQL